MRKQIIALFAPILKRQMKESENLMNNVEWYTSQELIHDAIEEQINSAENERGTEWGIDTLVECK